MNNKPLISHIPGEIFEGDNMEAVTYMPNTTQNLTRINIEMDYNVEPNDCLAQAVYHKDLTQLTSVTVIVVMCYSLVALLAVLGNLLVIWTVWRNTHMHTVTNYYLVNLAISDLLVATIVMPLKLLEYTGKCEWHVFMSDGLCSVVYYLLPIFVFASVLTLAAISIER